MSSTLAKRCNNRYGLEAIVTPCFIKIKYDLLRTPSVLRCCVARSGARAARPQVVQPHGGDQRAAFGHLPLVSIRQEMCCQHAPARRVVTTGCSWKNFAKRTRERREATRQSGCMSHASSRSHDRFWPKTDVAIARPCRPSFLVNEERARLHPDSMHQPLAEIPVLGKCSGLVAQHRRELGL